MARNEIVSVMWSHRNAGSMTVMILCQIPFDEVRDCLEVLKPYRKSSPPEMPGTTTKCRGHVGAAMESGLDLRTKQHRPLNVHEVDTVVSPGGCAVGERVGRAPDVGGIHASAA